MRCLPGCAASAVGGRAAAPPSRGRGVLLRRLAAASLRRLRVGVVCCFGGLPLRRRAAFARAWCVASAAYRCAAAPPRRLRAGVVCYLGGLRVRAGGTKGEVSPRLSLRESLTPQSRCASHLAAPPPSLTFRRLHEVLAWVCCFGGWWPRRSKCFG